MTQPVLALLPCKSAMSCTGLNLPQVLKEWPEPSIAALLGGNILLDQLELGVILCLWLG